MRKRRFVCFLLALALVLGLLPPLPSRAVDLAFVAVNDTIPTTLSGGGLPFHLGGSLYLPYEAVNQPSLGIYGSFQIDEGIISLIGVTEQLTFDLPGGTVTNKRGVTQDVTLMASSGQVFLPATLCASAFGVNISELTSKSGYSVIRMTNGSQVYDDSLFLEKAENLISYRVEQYLSPEDAAPQPVVKPAPPAAAEPEPDGAEPEEEEEEEEEPDPATVYLAFAGLDGVGTALDALMEAGQTAAFFLTAGEIEGNGALLCRILSAGHRLGIWTPSGTDLEASIRAANELLDRELHEKTLLVLLPEAAADEGLEASYSAFYLPETPLTAAEASEPDGLTRLLVLDGRFAREGLAALRENAAILPPLRETTVLPEPAPVEADGGT